MGQGVNFCLTDKTMLIFVYIWLNLFSNDE